MAIQLQPQEKDITRIVQAIIQLVEGRHNAGSNADRAFSLRPGFTTTVVSHPNCSVDSVVLLSPMTANAAAAIPTTYVSLVSQGAFTLTHLNNAQVDRTFRYTVTGG